MIAQIDSEFIFGSERLGRGALQAPCAKARQSENL